MPPRRPSGGLTPREQEVLALLAEGLTGREICARLCISTHTYGTHVLRIRHKLELASTNAVIVYGVYQAIFHPPADGSLEP